MSTLSQLQKQGGQIYLLCFDVKCSVKLRRYISESELRQEIMQQEREMMRRVKLRDSMRGAMASNSALAVSMQISALVETAMKESCALMKLVSDKALDLQDRQVLHRRAIASIYRVRSL
jgi:hypothetical protein